MSKTLKNVEGQLLKGEATPSIPAPTSVSSSNSSPSSYENNKYNNVTTNGYQLGGTEACTPGYGSMSAMRYPGYSENLVAAAKTEYSGKKSRTLCQ